MENATKALLIAAAVLVVILIISLGMSLFNMASEQVDNAGDLSEYEIQQFNDKFLKYEGTNVSGSDVNALIKTAFNHNQSQEDASTRVTVKNDKTGTGAKTYVNGVSFVGTASPDQVSTGSRYTVKCTYNTASKLITTITITANTNTNTNT